MIVQLILLVLGFVLLIKGADWLVNGASAFAKKARVSDLAIGLTIVAFGTSAPELVVNTFAASKSHFDIVLGNIIGSNNFNLFIILGITGMITPLVVKTSTIRKEIPISFIAAVIFFLLGNYLLVPGRNVITRWEGGILLVFFALFLLYVFRQGREEHIEVEEKKYSSLKIILLISIGLTGLVAGGRVVVDSAVKLATIWGLSEKIIGLTIIATGTSLPELATSAIAAVKKKSDIAIGNIVGSNIFNIFLILGSSAMVRPIVYNKIFNIDLYILASGTLLLFLAMFTGKRKKLERWEASILFFSYITYTIFLINKG